ncbi:MAG TPA: 50S ribosomal protein L29 [Gammaproteobacteria bacterium]|nr:50S ribosomal protein L29 [Gammaproteobacteria bacterium]
MKASELKSKSVKELYDEQVAIQREIFNLRMQRGIGQTPQTHLFRKLRRDIARIKTILREKEGS